MTTTTYPAHALKPGDRINGREVFDTRATFGFRFAVIFTDGSRLELPSDETIVEVN